MHLEVLMPRRSGRKTDYQWANVLVFGELRGAAVDAKVTGDNSLALITGARSTIMRIRGEVWVGADPDGAGNASIVGVGLILVNNDALAIGVTAIPGPLLDIGSSWIWHTTFNLFSGDAIAQDFFDISQNARREIDSKAMRKFEPNMSLVFVAENQTNGGAAVWDWGASCRVLLGL